MSLYRLERSVRLARQIRNPGRYAENRAKSRVLGVLGVWRLLRKVYR